MKTEGEEGGERLSEPGRDPRTQAVVPEAESPEREGEVRLLLRERLRANQDQGLAFQKTKDRFLEVKMESSRQRFFHLLSDVAYIEVSGSGPCRGAAWPQGGSGVMSWGCCHR